MVKLNMLHVLAFSRGAVSKMVCLIITTCVVTEM